MLKVAAWTIGEYGDMLVSEASNAISMVDEDGVGVYKYYIISLKNILLKIKLKIKL